MANGQLSLDLGMQERPDLLYFALRPDAGAASAMLDVAQRCKERHGLSERPFGADRLHVSLVPAISRHGVRRDDAAAALRAGSGVRAAPFPVVFDRLCTFGGAQKRPVVLCSRGRIAALEDLRQALRGELVKAGLWQGPARFRPHATLLWGRRPVPETRLDEAIGWTCDGFVLVKSLVGQRRHVDLGRWPLEAAGG
ncbi:2'-5' RNA ligase [Rhodobium orientis]|uniref:2'-5' RNA ligase n=1 Tax=Rhodobium orientis TaxID=34017 RepID=A0A327JKF9_9HYPH|nr:2'-5' RNA ligase family protein [Rhodobium orientis]MBB4302404.1 2'-5' RNA ligase [Rhodobium orientis]MBK5949108.1 hypothetical protein [Rhodobium orientis]RAI26571.1 hypothetical protein CH339_13255 [Rhodobium orientis]